MLVHLPLKRLWLSETWIKALQALSHRTLWVQPWRVCLPFLGPTVQVLARMEKDLFSWKDQFLICFKNWKSPQHSIEDTYFLKQHEKLICPEHYILFPTLLQFWAHATKREGQRCEHQDPLGSWWHEAFRSQCLYLRPLHLTHVSSPQVPCCTSNTD